MSDERSLLEEFAERLERHGVEFLVIGGQAESLFGSPRVTYDVDLCYRRTPENLKRLALMLVELGATLRGAPKGVPFKLDAKTLETGSNFTFETPIGDLDILGHVEPIGDFEQLAVHAETHPAGRFQFRTIALDDLIRVKRHLNRRKDQDSLFQLLAIKRLREETGLR